MYDVAVVGGGISGCIAAIAAARYGANVILIERYGFLGGTLTACGTGPMMTFHAGDVQAVQGITDELIERLKAKDYRRDIFLTLQAILIQLLRSRLRE